MGYRTLKQTKITKAAKGSPCTFNSDLCDPGVNNENVVFCHKNGAGMGQKTTDELGRDIGFFGCHACHTLYDTKQHDYYQPYFIDEMAEFAITRTKRLLVRAGIVGEEYTL